MCSHVLDDGQMTNTSGSSGNSRAVRLWAIYFVKLI